MKPLGRRQTRRWSLLFLCPAAGQDRVEDGNLIDRIEIIRLKSN